MRFPTLLAIFAIAPAWAGGDAPSPPTLVPGPKYQSVFADYRGWQDEPVKSWREANEEMRRLGGHMGHLDGAAAPLVPSEQLPDGRGEPSAHAGHRHGSER
ncbi:MAG: hypothetical protein FD131_4790 [Rhodocyclaceae bacterium]|nr:MAG: hypothetical protein FD131_4790 [Rhodocyclaceae bacterium]